MSMDWDQLHDATLVSITVDWNEGSAWLKLINSQGPSQPIYIQVTGLSGLKVPREFPWGKSSSINNVCFSQIEGEEVSTLEVEMQSGDVIEITAKQIHINHRIHDLG